jgi:hypothetical protein
MPPLISRAMAILEMARNIRAERGSVMVKHMHRGQQWEMPHKPSLAGIIKDAEDMVDGKLVRERPKPLYLVWHYRSHDDDGRPISTVISETKLDIFEDEHPIFLHGNLD